MRVSEQARLVDLVEMLRNGASKNAHAAPLFCAQYSRLRHANEMAVRWHAANADADGAVSSGKRGSG